MLDRRKSPRLSRNSFGPRSLKSQTSSVSLLRARSLSASARVRRLDRLRRRASSTTCRSRLTRARRSRAICPRSLIRTRMTMPSATTAPTTAKRRGFAPRRRASPAPDWRGAAESERSFVHALARAAILKTADMIEAQLPDPLPSRHRLQGHPCSARAACIGLRRTCRATDWSSARPAGVALPIAWGLTELFRSGEVPGSPFYVK